MEFEFKYLVKYTHAGDCFKCPQCSNTPDPNAPMSQCLKAQCSNAQMSQNSLDPWTPNF